jgi:hypothetical protein
LIGHVPDEDEHVRRNEDADVQGGVARIEDVIQDDHDRDGEYQRGRDEQCKIEKKLGAERERGEAAQVGDSQFLL